MTKKQTHKLSQLTKKMTQASALFHFLSEGHEFSAAEAKQSGIADPSRVVNKLRAEGVPIYLNDRKTKDGKTIRRYRLGTPRALANA